jgi:hypothetical protein
MKHLLYRGIFVVLFLSQGNAEETGTISGRIIDAETGNALPFVNIILDGTHLGTTSKLDGKFLLSRVPSGTYRVTASIVGFARVTKEIIIVPSRTAECDFTLAPLPTAASEILITSSRPSSAASASFIRAMDFELRPKHSTQDLLRMVPGLVIAQHAGGGKAEQIFLRGFDADHGTDVNISVDGIPVNMVSHGHGQGYADLHFVMPEVLKGFDVYKGPYYAQFGDFGTAGTVLFTTREEVEENLLSVEAGSFRTQRIFGITQLPLSSSTTSFFVAGEYVRTNGYFDDPQDFVRLNLFGKVRHALDAKQSVSVWASVFDSRWNASGQIPHRSVERGLISRFGSIDPTEGGATQRHNVHLSYSSLNQGSHLSVQSYYSRYRFQLFSNFTFFKDDPINGDAIEQVDDRFLAGGRIEYMFENALLGISGNTLLGGSHRTDGTNLELWHVAQRHRLENRVHAYVRQQNAAVFAQHELRFSDVIRLQLGVRGDYFAFIVDDKDPKRAHGTTSGSVRQLLVSPKANLTFSPSSVFSAHANAGFGFHSNDARAVIAQQSSLTLPRAFGAELGTRWIPSNRFSLSCALWLLDLEREFVYSGDEGTTEESGATRRVGIDVEVRAQLMDWLWGDIDVTLSRGRYNDLRRGEDYIPLAPMFTSTGGLTARHPSGTEGSLRYRHVGSRPANEDNSIRAFGYMVFDATFTYRIEPYRFMFAMENLFNTEWNEAQFATESRLRHESEPVSELHFTPGAPRSLLVKLEYIF